MSNPTRFLRPLANGDYHVIINTHTPLTSEARAADLESYGYVPEWTGRREIDEPVALIQRSPATYIGTGGPLFQMSQILPDDGSRFLAAGDNPEALAARLAEGEFDDDFRFEYAANPEPDQPSELYFVKRFATPSQRELESFTTDDPGREVAGAREAQAFTLEERWAMDAEREAAERARS